jgi:hypothetical protein
MKTIVKVFAIATLILAAATAIKAAPAPGPRRDVLGDVVDSFNLPYTENAGMKWDGQYIWCTCRTATRHLFSIDPADYQVVNDYELNQSDAIGLGWDPVRELLWVCEWQSLGTPSICHLYDRDGNDVGQVDLPRSGHWDFCYDGEYYYGNSENGGDDPKIYKLQWNENQDALDVVAEGPNLVNVINHGRAISIEYVPAHGANRFWVMSNENRQTGYISQVEVDWDENSAEVLQEFESNNDDYPHQGLTHDGYNLWAGGMWSGTTGYIYEDGIEEQYGILGLNRDGVDFGPITSGASPEETLTIYNLAEGGNAGDSLGFTVTDLGGAPDWLELDPTEGQITAGDSVAVTFTAVTEGLNLGEYERTVRIESTDIQRGDVDLPVHIFVVEGFGRLYGVATDAANEQPVEGAVIVINDYGYSDTSDAEGNYSLDNLPAWTYDLTVTKTNYLTEHPADVEVANGAEVERNFALLHAEFHAEPAELPLQMPANHQREELLTISNIGNGPLTWALDLIYAEGVETPPWDLRLSLAAGDTVNDNRLTGVVYADGNYYVAGGQHDVNNVYVLNREGEYQRRFPQFGVSNFGYPDMDYDGETIWGVAGRMCYGFNTDGDSVAGFELPFRSTQGVAWDADDSLLWMSELIGNIKGFSRDGQEREQIPGFGFRVKGLAYWPDDPDNHPLYVFHDLNDSMAVHKIDPNREDTMFVRFLHPERGGQPCGAFITSRFDPYSWVFISVADATEDQGGDRVDVWQLEAKTDWVAVEPMQGEVEAEAEAELTVTLNTADLLPENYAVGLQFTHDGVGGINIVPLTLEVIPDTVPPPPENHPPSAFDLLEPLNESEFYCPNSGPDTIVTFHWQQSMDPDLGDTVRYIIWFSRDDWPQNYVDSLFYEIPDTSFTTGLAALVWDSLESQSFATHITWWVKAYSGQDTVECNQRFVFDAARPDEVRDGMGSPFTFGISVLAPNPFNSRLLIDYGLDIAGEASISIYDLFGREVARLASGRQTPGRYRVTWDAAGMPSGVYLVRLTHTIPGLQANRGTQRWEQRKVVLVK